MLLFSSPLMDCIIQIAEDRGGAYLLLPLKLSSTILLENYTQINILYNPYSHLISLITKPSSSFNTVMSSTPSTFTNDPSLEELTRIARACEESLDAQTATEETKTDGSDAIGDDGETSQGPQLAVPSLFKASQAPTLAESEGPSDNKSKETPSVASKDTQYENPDLTAENHEPIDLASINAGLKFCLRFYEIPSHSIKSTVVKLVKNRWPDDSEWTHFLIILKCDRIIINECSDLTTIRCFQGRKVWLRTMSTRALRL